MGGKYIPLIRGEIYGLKIGIDTEINLREHSQKLNFDELGGEYLIGFGVGFTKAQQIREKLKSKQGNLSFEEQVRLYKYLVVTHADRYREFKEISRTFLENIDEWGNEKIPKGIKEEVLLFLKDQKIQRAVYKINDFNYKNFRLELITQYQEIKILLPNLREQKKKGNISSLEYRKGKKELERKIINWITKRKN